MLSPPSTADGALLARGADALLHPVQPADASTEPTYLASDTVMQTEARLLQRLKDSQRVSRVRRCTSFAITFALVGGSPSHKP